MTDQYQTKERGYTIYPSDEEPTKDADTFYNSHMILNRDISEIALQTYKETTEHDEFHICDPLAASGIRGIRYAKYGDRTIINDANPTAVENIKKALKQNQIEAETTRKDANVLLSQHKNYFTHIDIDPFGPFTNFLDSTARSAKYDSLIGFTATDNAAVSGTYPKVCKRRYGSKPLQTAYQHEVGLRIYIKTIFENFARYDKAFEPRISYQKRHYSRIIGRVTESKKRVNKNLENIGYLSHCKNCLWRDFQETEKCPNCENEVERVGPLWTGRLNDRRFLDKAIERTPEEWEEANQLIKQLREESEIITPYYNIHELCSSLGISSPKIDELVDKIHEKGYPVTKSSFSPLGFRTEAPIDHIRKYIKELV